MKDILLAESLWKHEDRCNFKIWYILQYYILQTFELLGVQRNFTNTKKIS